MVKLTASVGLLVAVLTSIFACTGRAEEAHSKDHAAARKTIDTYLRAEAKADYRTMTPLFTSDARLTYTYEWGYGYDDSVYELDLSKVTTSVKDTHWDELEGYETLGRRYRIAALKPRPNGDIEASVFATERYRYAGYEGTAHSKIELVLREVAGAPRIARLTSVTTY